MEAVAPPYPPMSQEDEAELKRIFAEIDASQERTRIRRAEFTVIREEIQEIKADSARIMQDIRATMARIREMR